MARYVSSPLVLFSSFQFSQLQGFSSDSLTFICFLAFWDGLHLAENTQHATGPTPEE